MNVFLYLTGAFTWYVRATIWYITLGLKLFFSIGFDTRSTQGKEVSDLFIYSKPRSYRRFRKGQTGND